MKKILIIGGIVSGALFSSQYAFAQLFSSASTSDRVYAGGSACFDEATGINKCAPVASTPITLGASVPCSKEKIDEVLTPATAASPTVLVACRLDLKSSDKITKQILVNGAEANGTRVNCNGATLAASYAQHSIKVSSKKIEDPSSAFPAGVWSRPYDVRFSNCSVLGGISIEGIPTSNNAGVYQDSSRIAGHTKRVQDAAPSNISFFSMKITAQGKTPFYVYPGATNISLISSVIDGNTNGTSAIYLDAETAGNIIKNNTFTVDTLKPGITVKTPSVSVPSPSCGTHRACAGPSWAEVCTDVPNTPYSCKKDFPPVITYTLDYPYQREIIAIDGSANNQIIGNTFNNLFPGGIYLYRNCGEGGTVRHQTPRNNQIIGNTFNFNKKTDKPAIWISSRDGGRFYCEADKGYGLGSSIDNSDYAVGTVIANNVISGTSNGGLVKIGGSTLSNIDKKAVEDLKNAIVAVVGAVLGILANPVAAPLTTLTAPAAALTAPLTVPLGGVAPLFAGFLLPGGGFAAEILYDQYQVAMKTGSIINPIEAITGSIPTPAGVINGSNSTSTSASKGVAPCYVPSENKLYEHGGVRIVSGNTLSCKDGVWSSPVVGALSPIRDVSGKYQLAGWACLKKSSTPVSVELYARSNSGEETSISTILANATTTTAIDGQCETKDVPHTFSYRFSTTDLNTFKGQAIYARAISGVVGIENEVLVGSGSVLPRVAPTTKGVLGALAPIKDQKGKYVISGYACLKSSSFPIKVNLYVDKIGKETFLKQLPANIATNENIDTRCDSVNVPHTFSYELTPAQFEQYKGKEVLALGLSGVNGITNEPLASAAAVTIPEIPPSTRGVTGVLNSVRDFSGSYQLSGWACLLSSPRSIDVGLYVDNVLLKNVPANATSTEAINAKCGTPGAFHNFSYTMTEADIEASKNKTITAYGFGGEPSVARVPLDGDNVVVPATKPLTTNNPLALRMTLNPDYKNQTITSGNTNIKIGSFVIKNPNKKDTVVVSNIKIGFVERPNALSLKNLVNLSLTESGASLASSINDVQQSNMFLTSLALGPGASKTVDVSVDLRSVAADPSLNVTPALALLKAVTTVSLPPVATPQQKTVSGTIQVTLLPVAANAISGVSVSAKSALAGQIITASVAGN